MDHGCVGCLIGAKQQSVSEVQHMTDALHYLSSVVMETADNLATGVHLNDETMFGNCVCDSTGQVKLGGAGRGEGAR